MTENQKPYTPERQRHPKHALPTIYGNPHEEIQPEKCDKCGKEVAELDKQ